MPRKQISESTSGCFKRPSAELEVLPPLTSVEAEEKQGCESRIREHLQSYFECAKAIKVIHDKRLYRDEYGTFEAYCIEKWGLSRTYAHRQMRAAEIIEKLLIPMGNLPLPQNESQVRPLTALPDEKIPGAWKQVTKRARGAKITASLVIDVVTKLQPPTEPANGERGAHRDIRDLLQKVVQAVSRESFDEALHVLEQAHIRIDIEAQKKRTPTLE